MGASENNLPLNELESPDGTKNALLGRLKNSMQRETQETNHTRRGFMHAVAAGGAVLGFSTLAVIGASQTAEAASCSSGFACAENYTCDDKAVSCGGGFACSEGYSSSGCSGCQDRCETGALVDPLPPPQKL